MQAVICDNGKQRCNVPDDESSRLTDVQGIRFAGRARHLLRATISTHMEMPDLVHPDVALTWIVRLLGYH